MRTASRLIASATFTTMLLLGATSRAQVTPQGKCVQNLFRAAANYTKCEQTALGTFYRDPSFVNWYKCPAKYAAKWTRLQTAYAGTLTTCDNDRFEDNGDGTVTDRLTALQWEQKTDDASVHDKDNTYTWSDFGDGDLTDADGTAFTTFLATLNGGGCFARHCDWRLPTVYELQTILTDAFCATPPCIDQGLFGPTLAEYYWASFLGPGIESAVYFGTFANGFITNNNLPNASLPVRAVRGGL